MKPTLHPRLTIAIAAVLAVVTTGAMATAAGTGTAWEPVLSRQDGSLDRLGQHVPPQYDLALLALGRAVYADLQRARQAVLDRKTTNLYTALREASETVRRLQRPAEYAPLRAQLQIIRNDLADRGKQLDQTLWVPVMAEVDDVLVYLPGQAQARTRTALRQARAAAAAGTRGQVAAQLDVVTASLEYSLGVFPLDRVGADLDAARRSAGTKPPDWSGALEAVQSALAAFHWYTRVPARALLSAYNDAISAYVLATGPLIADDQPLEITGYLARAERALGGLPDSQGLVARIRTLIERKEPGGAGIRQLLDAIQARIRAEQEQARVQYWTAVGPATPE
ncbi:MAG: YfdX family protein [Pseudomonadota bacterium]